ncbi:MAG: hypothetical protein J6Y19_10725 [Kiritimatiellae bacterium]|nr:hypothetical protein [Kiritimatiellia bacterium]
MSEADAPSADEERRKQLQEALKAAVAYWENEETQSLMQTLRWGGGM